MLTANAVGQQVTPRTDHFTSVETVQSTVAVPRPAAIIHHRCVLPGAKPGYVAAAAEQEAC